MEPGLEELTVVWDMDPLLSPGVKKLPMREGPRWGALPSCPEPLGSGMMYSSSLSRGRLYVVARDWHRAWHPFVA